MIRIKKTKYDNYCTCCRKPFDDSMEISFSHKDFSDSTVITLCGKCRRELMEALGQQNLCDGVKSHSEREILNACIQLLEEMVGHFRVYLDWADFKPNDEEKECGYFGMTYFHIVQTLFLRNTSHSGGTSTRQKCWELGIKDCSEGVRFALWEGEEAE